MNLLHMKYAVEVAQTGSINKAAEKLLIGQPNLSRAIKELESSLDIKIFERSAKGMTLTPAGETFMSYAKSILKQVDAVEETFKRTFAVKKRFSLAAPRSSYISAAFAAFSDRLSDEPEVEAFYRETSNAGVLHSVLQENYRLGILRYAEKHDRYYKAMLDEKGLSCELITEFSYVLAMGQDSPLAAKETVTPEDLTAYTEIAHADPDVPSLPVSETKKEESSDPVPRKIFVFERGSQLDLLRQNPRTFMWVSPLPRELREKSGLLLRRCAGPEPVFRDVLIYRKGSALSKLDSAFVEQLIKTKRETMSGEDVR